jgi:hypothetical protein
MISTRPPMRSASRSSAASDSRRRAIGAYRPRVAADAAVYSAERRDPPARTAWRRQIPATCGLQQTKSVASDLGAGLRLPNSLPMREYPPFRFDEGGTDPGTGQLVSPSSSPSREAVHPAVAATLDRTAPGRGDLEPPRLRFRPPSSGPGRGPPARAGRFDPGDRVACPGSPAVIVVAGLPSREEDLCLAPSFKGWDVDGGYRPTSV